MSAVADKILAELQRHEAQPSFNLRCKCGHIEKTVSEIGDFERHVAAEIASALAAAGLVTEAESGAAAAGVPADDLADDERHTAWCQGGHEGRCRRGRLTGTEKQAAL